VEGKNIVIEWRSAEGKLDRLPALAAELMRLKVDIIVTSGASVTRAAKEATTTIPIVFAQDGDPVANGFVASLERPGARRPCSGAAEEVRADHQPESGESDRADDSAQRVGESGSGDQITLGLNCILHPPNIV
jgi:ABC-type uncharacterized transport system substrate-binding protein